MHYRFTPSPLMWIQIQKRCLLEEFDVPTAKTQDWHAGPLLDCLCENQMTEKNEPRMWIDETIRETDWPELQPAFGTSFDGFAVGEGLTWRL